MAEKRKRIADLLSAQIDSKSICNIVNCSRQLVFNVKKRMEAGDSLERKPGSGGHNKIRNDEFLKDLARKIEERPETSMGSWPRR